MASPDQAGLRLPDDAAAEVLAQATAFYAQQLETDPAARSARQLLTDRRLPDQAVRDFTLGFAPAGPAGVVAHLSRLGHRPQALLRVGLCLRTRDGRLVDRFRNRLMLPLHHPLTGQVQAFLGRDLPSGSGDQARLGATPRTAAKYLNSPTTRSYSKGGTVYGLGTDTSRRALASGAHVVLVEGPLDALAVTYASALQHEVAAMSLSSADCTAPAAAAAPWFIGVATCGTALTRDQLQVIAAAAAQAADIDGPPDRVPSRPERHRDRDGDSERGRQQRQLVLAYDGDAPGQAAAARALPVFLSEGVWPLATHLPRGQDPAEVIVTEGPQALVRALTAALSRQTPLADVAVDAALDRYAAQRHWAEGVIAAARAAAHVVASLPPAKMPRQVARIAAALALPHPEVTALVAEHLSDTSPGRFRAPPRDVLRLHQRQAIRSQVQPTAPTRPAMPPATTPRAARRR